MREHLDYSRYLAPAAPVVKIELPELQAESLERYLVAKLSDELPESERDSVNAAIMQIRRQIRRAA